MWRLVVKGGEADQQFTDVTIEEEKAKVSAGFVSGEISPLVARTETGERVGVILFAHKAIEFSDGGVVMIHGMSGEIVPTDQGEFFMPSNCSATWELSTQIN